MGFRNGFSGESSGLEEITGGKLARWWRGLRAGWRGSLMPMVGMRSQQMHLAKGRLWLWTVIGCLVRAVHRAQLHRTRLPCLHSCGHRPPSPVAPAPSSPLAWLTRSPIGRRPPPSPIGWPEPVAPHSAMRRSEERWKWMLQAYVLSVSDVL
jgi:hypothetical protein